ncbi:hypothetical protein BH10CHL1_BH10CHL1_17930 [soil metagenome]
MVARANYTKEFKIQIVHLVQSSGLPMAEIERQLGFGQGIIKSWVAEYKRLGDEAFPGPTGPKGPREKSLIDQMRRLEKKLGTLKRNLESTERERDILQKAVALLAKPKPAATWTDLPPDKYELLGWESKSDKDP